MSEDVNIEVLDGGLGLLPSSGDEVHAVIGTCSAGTVGQVVATRNIDNLIAARGYGPAVQAAAVAIKLTGKTVLFVRAATNTAGKVKGSDTAAVNLTSSTDATPIVVTAAADHGLVDGDIVTIAAHTTNTTANGVHVVDVSSTTVFSLPGVAGAGGGAGAAGTVTKTGVRSYQASGAAIAAGTSQPTITGTPVDTFRVRWKWVLGGTRGAAGATFKYSLDGGASYSAELQIGTATSYVIPNTGLTINFSAGTWIAGDEYRFNTVEPKWAAGGVTDAIEALGAISQKFRLIHLIGDLSASDAVTFDTDLEGLATQYRYVGLLGHARDADFDAAEDETAWSDDIKDDFSSFTSTRVSVTAGHYQVSSPIDGRKYRRPLSFPAAARLMGRPIQEHAGRVRTGALKGVAIPSDSDTVKLALDAHVYHDERNTPSLDVGRFFTARTRIGRPGLFVKSPRMMSSPSSDYQIWPHRSVIDKACDITYEVLVDVLNDDLQLDPTTGFIVEKEAKAIESRLRSAFRDGITSKRAASAVNATISRDDNIITTKTLTAAIRVVPKGYVEGIDASVGFTNPALELG